MAYDPQRDRRRPRPSGDDPAPVEAILDADGRPATGGASEPAERGNEAAPARDQPDPVPVPDDPPPDPSVTPQPADPWSDRLLFGVSISTVVGVVVAVIVFRWLWSHGRRTRTTDVGG